MMNTETMNAGLKRAFSGMKGGQSTKPQKQPQKQEGMFNPMNVEQKKSSKINIPNYWGGGEQKKFSFSPQQQKEEPEEQPYWSAQDWESWALELYENYPDTHKFLPEWFIEAVSD